MQVGCSQCGKVNRFPVNKIGDNPVCGSCRNHLLSSPIILNKSNIEEFITQNTLPVIIDFWAPWCGPCKIFAPTFKTSATKYSKNIIFAKVDTEAEQELGSRYNIRSIPTLAYFWKGKELGRVSGALPQEQLNDLVLKIIQHCKNE